MIQLAIFAALGVVALSGAGYFMSSDACRLAVQSGSVEFLSLEQKVDQLSSALSRANNVLFCWSSVSVLVSFGIILIFVGIIVNFQLASLKSRK